MRFIALVTALLMTCTASADMLMFDSKADVNDIINNMSAKLSGLIAQAGTEARVTMGSGYQLADVYLRSLQLAYADSVHVTFDRLDVSQQKAFIDAGKMLDRIDQKLNPKVDAALQEWTNTNEIIADAVSIISSKPLVTFYGPAYIAPRSILKEVPISIAGVRLFGKDVPKLVINGKEYDPKVYEQGNIGFVVDRSDFPVLESGTSFVYAKLVFQRDQRWIKWPSKGAGRQEYRLMFTVLPENLGSYSTVLRVGKPSEERVRLKSRLLSAAREGGGGAEDKECYEPQEGYTFDHMSAKLVETLHTAHKDNDTSAGTNDGGMYYVDGYDFKKLICVKAVAHTGCTECGARTQGFLEVDMVKTVYTDVETTGVARPLSWKADSYESLAEGAKAQLLNITLFDDITYSVSATELRDLRFLNIVPDINNHEVFLRPNRDWSGRR